MSLNSDWIELLKIFTKEKVRFLVVGGHAYVAHAPTRSTDDLDLWVEPTPENAERVWKSLVRFGAPLRVLKPEDLLKTTTVYQMGQPPNRVDILTGIAALTFDEAWSSRVAAKLGGVPVFMLSREDLIRNKLEAGRPQDLLDVEKLRKTKRRKPKNR